MSEFNQYDQLRIVPEEGLKLTQEERDKRMLIKYDRLEAMHSGVHCKTSIDFDGQPFTLRLLSAQERLMASEKAMEEHFKKPQIIQWKPNLDLLMQVHILFYALTPCPEQANEGYAQLKIKDLWHMTENQINRLYQIWMEFDKEKNPDIDNMTEEEFNILLEDVKKKPELLLGASYRQLQRIATFYSLREAVITQQGN